jgi:uncharacterized membrane protein
MKTSKKCLRPSSLMQVYDGHLHPFIMMTHDGKKIVLERKLQQKKKDRHGNGEL